MASTMSVFEAGVFDSYETVCAQFGLSLRYANKTFEVLDKGVQVFKGNTLETHKFLRGNVLQKVEERKNGYYSNQDAPDGLAV